MYSTRCLSHFHSNQLIIIFILLLISSQTHQSDALKSLNTKTRQGRNVDSGEELNNKVQHNLTSSFSLPAESRQSDGDDLQFSSKPYYSSRLNDLDYYNSPSSSSPVQLKQPKPFERRDSVSAPDFQANAAGFYSPDYLANTASSSNNILNKLTPYDSISNGAHSTLEDYNGAYDKNSFVPSTNLRERRKGNNYLDGNDSPQKTNFYERQLDDQSQYEPLFSHKSNLNKHHHHQPRDNEFASNSLLESVSPLDNGQDFGFLSNDFGANSNYNNELSALNNLNGLRSLNGLGALSPALSLNPSINSGLNGYNNLSPLAASSSSIVGTLGGSLNGLNGLSSVVPPGAIVGAPGSSPPPGMKLAGYVTVTNPSPNVGSMSTAGNLLASPATQQQMLLNQVMNRNPQAQALAQVMAQSMAQGIRIPFTNPYGNNLQLLSPGNLNGQATSSSNSGSKSSNNGNSNKDSSNSNSNSESTLSNGGEQQVAASSTNRAKFLQRLNPLNLFRRLRTRNQKNNSKQNTKDQSGGNSNEINNNIPDLEDRSQFFLPADLLLGSASTTSQQQLPQLTLQQQQLAEQLSAQLAQLNFQLAKQSNNKAKFLRKVGSSQANAAVKKVAKRDLSNQLTSASEQPKNGETIPYSLENETPLVRHNATSSNDTEAAENEFFPVANIYQNYKFNIRPRFRFPSAREQRRISNSHGLHVNTNNFLTSSSIKSNFVSLMGSRNYEVIAGGILNNEGHRGSDHTDHSMLHGMHSNNEHGSNQKLPHHHQNQRNIGHLTPNKGKFNIDNDFDDDDDSEEDDHSFNGPVNQSNANQRTGNNVMFLDDLFGSNMQNAKNNGMLGFQGFNNFNGGNQQFNALSSASSYSNHQLNNSSLNQSVENTAQSEPTEIKSIDNKIANQTSKV